MTIPSSSRKEQHMNNTRIRIKMAERGLKQWELARLMKISEPALSRKLRDELEPEEQDRIINLIENGGDCDER